VVYFAASGFNGLAVGGSTPFGAVRTALVPAAPAEGPHADPTGCGDVWGATYFSRLLAGDNLADAMQTALVAAARNVGHRGAAGLAHYLRGELSPT
jgi:sugar/nucleoside kinase (ribokinase family)